MTHPVIVNAVENDFIPLLIVNNKQGADAKMLAKYKEPAWNYQVIRFLNADGKDIIPRKDRINTRAALIPRMITALEKAQRPVPAALRRLQNGAKVEKIAFAQHCYWTGSARLGGLDGVLTTEAGWIGGREVTLLSYDESTISTRKLIDKARQLEVASKVYVTNKDQQKAAGGTAGKLDSSYRKAKASDQKRQIQGTPFAKLKLTPEQACKVNAFCRSQPKKALELLTEDQRKLVLKSSSR